MSSTLPHPLLKYFRYDHLPAHLAGVSAPFCETALRFAEVAASSGYDPTETTVALRKLLEAKDAAVRASLPPSPAPTTR